MTRSLLLARVLPLLAVVGVFIVYLSNGRFVESTDTFGNELLPISILQQHNLWFDQYFVAASSPASGSAAVVPGSIPTGFEYRVLPEDPTRRTPWWFTTINGHAVSFFPIVPGLLNTPVYAVASWMGVSLGDNVIALTHVTTAAVAALSVLCMYLCLAQCSQKRTAIFLSVSFAFGTAVWSTNSRSLYQHGPSLLFITAAIAALLTRRRALVGLAGFLLGMAVFDRPTNAITAAALGLYVLRRQRSALPLFCVLAAIPLGLMAWYSSVYWGSPFALGQGNTPDIFTQANEPLQALVGLLLSPNRGLLVFSPIFAFGLAFAVYILFLRRRVGPALLPYLIWASAGIYGLYCFWPDWIGGHTYGYRFLIDVTPVLMLTIAACWDRLVAPYPAVRTVFTMAVLASILIQGLGAVTAPCGYDDEPNNINYHHERLWDVADGEIARCTQMQVAGIQDVATRW